MATHYPTEREEHQWALEDEYRRGRNDAMNDIRCLVKRWFAAPHRASSSQPYQCIACRILVELMELVAAVDPHADSTGMPSTRD